MFILYPASRPPRSEIVSHLVLSCDKQDTDIADLSEIYMYTKMDID